MLRSPEDGHLHSGGPCWLHVQREEDGSSRCIQNMGVQHHSPVDSISDHLLPPIFNGSSTNRFHFICQTGTYQQAKTQHPKTVIIITSYVRIKSRLKSGNACYYSVKNLLSSTLLSKNLKIKKYSTIILTAVLYGCETLSLTLREERRQRVFENRVLRIFGPKRDEVTGEWRKLHNGMICTPHPMRFG